jgi:hypothetical protein
MDQRLRCIACGLEFVYSLKEQEVISKKGWGPPKSCLTCRAKRKQRLLTTKTNIEVKASEHEDPEVLVSSSLGKRRGIDDKTGPNEVSLKTHVEGLDRSIFTEQASKRHCPENESNPQRLEQRLKQIQYGYNTVAYDAYIAAVPKHKRLGPELHPRTPDPYEKQSKRAFDGRYKKWRRDLHKFEVGGGVVGELEDVATIALASVKKSNDIGQQTPTLDKIEVITTAKSIEEIESSEQFGDDSVFNAEAFSDSDDDDVL